MITDTTFFTNEPGYALLDRFKKTLEHVKYFDILVGYFRTSGFHQLCESLESHSRTKRVFSEQTASEMELSEDSYDIEIGINFTSSSRKETNEG